MAVLPEEAGCANDNVNTVNTSLYGLLSVTDVASDVWTYVRREARPGIRGIEEEDERVRILALRPRLAMALQS